MMHKFRMLFHFLLTLFLLMSAQFGAAAEKAAKAPPKTIAGSGTEYFTGSDQYPPTGKYISPSGVFISTASGVQIKDAVLRGLSHHGSPPALGVRQFFDFDCAVELSLSTDGGSTWSGMQTPCACAITLSHSSDSGSTQIFDTEMLQMSISVLPAGAMVRESPTLASTGKTTIRPVPGGYMVSSFFDIFVELSLDGGATWQPTSRSLHLDFSCPPEQPFVSSNFPPPGQFVSNSGDVTVFPNGILVRDADAQGFSSSSALPALGASQTDRFTASCDLDVSTDGGLTWSTEHGECDDAVSLRHTDDDSVASFFDTEMLQMNISGLPSGIMIRESPSLASTGKLTSRPAGDGSFRVSSFFDIFTESSTDGGMTWSPSSRSMAMELAANCPAITVSPDTLPDGATGVSYPLTFTPSGGTPSYSFMVYAGQLPPGVRLSSGGVLSGSPLQSGIFTFTVQATDAHACFGLKDDTIRIYPPDQFTASNEFPPVGRYSSPPGVIISTATGTQIRDVVLRDLDHVGHLPGLGSSQMYTFSCTVYMDVSTDRGSTWSGMQTACACAVSLSHSSDNGSTQTFDTEMLQMNISGLSGGVMLRESPTLSSQGGTRMRQVPGGYMITSFFDVFTELSTDGGMTWTPASSSLHLDFSCPPEQSFLSGNYPPPGEFVSNPTGIVVFQNGMAVRSLVQHGFSSSSALPALGASQTDRFTASCDLDVSTNGGSTWSTEHGDCDDAVSLRRTDDDSVASFFDTEMLQMNISGLPGGVMLRESPTKQSTGRMTSRPASDGSFRVSSFFDIFTELSTDGGMTWSPSGDCFSMTLTFLDKTTSLLSIANRWNMVSVPVGLNDFRKSSVFPTAVSNAFSYEGGYATKDTLRKGAGYWLKFNGAQTDSMTGSPFDDDSITVVLGWNMIGSLSHAVSVASISSIPPGIVTSHFFGYSNGYTTADSIQPGKAYWVKVSQSGQLVLSTSSSLTPSVNRIRVIADGELPPPPPEEQKTASVPKEFGLEQNYPNPFNPTTVIEYELPEQNYVTLKVYNTLGEEVATLVNATQSAGYKSVQFDASRFSSGLYIYRIAAGNFNQVRKMMLVK